MIVVNSLDAIPALPKPIALTIGNFDGVHLGHQHLLQEVKKRGTAVVLTFSNHPAEVLHKTAPTSLCSFEEKLGRLKEQGVDLVIALPFTVELSQTPYDQFLRNIQHHLPFDVLVLGEGAVLGHKGEGNAERIQALGIAVCYLPLFSLDGHTISSRKIRELIKINPQNAQQLLGKGIR